MDQRVNIQYSIDIEELPNEMQRLLQKSVDTLKEVCTVDLKELSSFDNKSLFSVGSIATIDATRARMIVIPLERKTGQNESAAGIILYLHVYRREVHRRERRYDNRVPLGGGGSTGTGHAH